MKKLGSLGLPLLALTVSAGAIQAQQAPFGASLAVSSGQVLVGEPSRMLGPGMVYVYEKDGSEWVEVGQLTASDGETGDVFGVAIAADASTALITKRGGVLVFERSGSEWRETGRIWADDVEEGQGFGQGLAISGDHAVVSAPNQGEGNGAVYLFRREGGEWVQAAKVTPEAEGTAFGTSVAFDGEYVVVGAPLAETRRGAAFVYRATDQGLELVSELPVEGLRGRTQFGQGVYVGGGWALVLAPFVDQATGAVFAYMLDDEGTFVPAGRLNAFDGGVRTVFGSSLAVAPDVIWVGAQGAGNFAGAVYGFELNATQDDFTGVTKVTGGEVLPGQVQYGTFMATDGEILAVAAPGSDYGAGSVQVLERDAVGDWAVTGLLESEPEGFNAVKGEEVRCSDDGEAVGWECSDVDLVSFVPVSELAGPEGGRGIRTNDNWGWKDPETGRYYALVGMTDRASFVDMTDPLNPHVVGILPMTETANGSSWRDLKTYENHAFIVSDGAGQHGMQVFDLTRLREYQGEPILFDADALYTEIASAHNIVINEETGFAFSVGSSSGGVTCGGGLHIIDIRDPKNPTFAGCFSDPQTGRASTGYTHDAQCVTYRGPDEDYQGREICFGANETALSIGDVTDKENTVAISRASYPSVAYSHQAWLSEDQAWLFMNDELDELQGLVGKTRTLIWDVSDLDDPQLVAEHMGVEESSDHNLYIVGDLMYQSNYQSGLRILDIQDPANPVEVAYFDTVPYGDNGAGFGGSWSNYPFFDNGLVIVTSGAEGLFVVRPEIRRTVF